MGEITNLPQDNYDFIPVKHDILCIYSTSIVAKKYNYTHYFVTYLSTVQVLMFLQEFICLLYCHFIVAIIKVI